MVMRNHAAGVPITSDRPYSKRIGGKRPVIEIIPHYKI